MRQEKNSTILSTFLVCLLFQFGQLALNAQGCSDNLLNNPDFELDLTSWGSAGNITLSDNAFSGNNAVRICTSGDRIYQSMPVTPGSTYSISLYGARENNGYGLLVIKYLNSNWTPIGQDFIPMQQTASYHLYTASSVAPAEANYLEIGVLMESDTGCITVDSWCITEDDPLPNNTFSCDSNLLQNGDFESGLSAWNPIVGSSSLSTDAYSGNSAFGACPQSGAFVYIQNVPVEVGYTYTLFYHGKYSGDIVSPVALRALDQNYVPIGASESGLVNTLEYYLFTMLRTVPANAAYLEIKISSGFGTKSLTVLNCSFSPTLR